MKFTTLGNIGAHGRYGYFDTRKGRVFTPTFMPDGTRGAVKGLLPEQVAATGVNVVLANTFHLHLQPGEKVIRSLGGVHGFSGWKGPMLTDSGGFQIFSLSKLRKITEDGVTFKDPNNGDTRFISPEKSIQIQLELGADMIVAFDDLSGLSDTEKTRIPEALERTHRWLDRCIAEFERLTAGMSHNERPLLFGVVQGGLSIELRRKSLEFVQSRNVDGIAIGGLSVGETSAEMYSVLEGISTFYDIERPRFLLGVGAPKDLRVAIENGIDMLDCVLPTRNARHGTVWVRNPCTCGENSGKAGLSAASRAISGLDSSDSSSRRTRVRLDEIPQAKTATSFECKTCGPLDKGIHLTNNRFTEDPGPIDSSCDCYTCTSGFSLAFLKHQFKVHEPLAGSLASIHNLRYLTRICEEYRAKPD